MRTASTSFVRKQADQDLQQVVALPAEFGHASDVDFNVERDRQHLDEAAADATVAGVTSRVAKPLDLRQDFERATLGCNDANHLPGAQIVPAVRQDTRASFAAQRRRPSRPRRADLQPVPGFRALPLRR